VEEPDCNSGSTLHSTMPADLIAFLVQGIRASVAGLPTSDNVASTVGL
jgi:hypothetical protein